MGKVLHFTISIPAALVAMALLLLNGREIAGAALQNAAALRLLAPWQEVTADPSSLLACPPGGPGPAADALIEAALRLRPETGSAWLLQGRSAWLAGRCSEAREAWRRAVALAPQNRAAWLLYLLSGPPDLLPEPTIAEGVANYLAFLGDRARSAERWEEALRWYGRSFSLAPDVPTASRLEAVYLKLERKEGAVARWEELAAHLPPSDPGHWWALGRAAELSQDWERAALFYGEGARRSDAPYDYRMRQGAALERLKDWAGAEAAYRRAVEARPDLFWPYLSVGHMRRAQKDYDGALAWYRKAESLAPNRYEPRYWVGLAQYLRGEDQAAEEAFRAALEMNPQHAWSAYYLAQSLYRQDRREEAVSWLRTAIGLYKGQPWNWAVQLGDWLAESGDKEGALAAYRQALEWRPGDEGIERMLSKENKALKVLVVFGTRPEAIKLAPVIRELWKYSDRTVCKICVTAQHRQMLDQVLRLFEISPDYDLNVMEDNQSPTQVAAAVLARLEPILQEERPDWVLVQGDTTTVAAASLAAFYARVKVGHVEAGLRTYDKWQPFPEEINRRVAGIIADLHFAPTEQARQNLMREGVPAEHILVTGNPVIDALHWVAALPSPPQVNELLGHLGKPAKEDPPSANPIRLILVTAHRRENFGWPLENICLALRAIAERYGRQVHIVYPVHLNPNVWGPVHRLLGDVPNITLVPPLDYLSLVHLMKRSYLVLTDSGGIQEEAPSLGKPVLVLREVTERPEGVEAGTVRVVGVERETIVRETVRLLEDSRAYEAMASAVNPYGDGHAAERIVAALLGGKVSPFEPAGVLKSA